MTVSKAAPRTPLVARPPIETAPPQTEAAPAAETAPETRAEVSSDGFVGSTAAAGEVTADDQKAQNKETIRTLYAAMDAGDGATMAGLYHPDAVFEDPAFGVLRGPEIGAMWMMLTSASSDLSVKASKVGAKPDKGVAHWDADYTFSATGNKVHNSIDAKFKFQDGKIIDHKDSFSFPQWAGQAFGLDRFGGLGRMLSKSKLLQKTMQHFARRQLFTFMEKQGIERPG